MGKTDVVDILRSRGHSMARAYIRSFGTGWYEALLDWQDPYLHLSAALTLVVLIPAICLQRAFGEAKLTAWMILDCLDVAFNPTGSFKDRRMTMPISPVPGRLDAVLAQLGL